MSESASGGPLDRRLLVLAAAVAFLDTLFFTVLAPLLPHYRDAAFSDSGIGVLTAGYALGSLAFAIPSGFLAVRIGPRRVLVGGLIGLGIGSICFGAAVAPSMLIVARIIQGAAGAMIWSGALTWLIEGTPSARKGEAIGIATGVGIFGALAGPAIGAAAALTAPGMIFPMLGAICLIVAVVAAASNSPGSDAVESGPLLVAALRSRSVRRAFFLFTIPAICFGVLALSAPLRMDTLGGTAVLIGAAYTGSAAAEGLLAPIVGRWSDTRGRLTPYAVGLGVCGVGVIAVAVAPTSMLLVAAVVAASAGGGIFITPAFALLSDAAERNETHQGIAVSLANFGWSAGQALGGLAAGLLHTSGGEALPLVLAASILFGMLALTFANRDRFIALEGPRQPESASPALPPDFQEVG